MSLYRTDFQTLLENYQNLPVAVEFECGGCCKRAAGVLNGTGPNYVIIGSPQGSFVRITTYCGSNPPVEEVAAAIIIKKHSIVAVERGPLPASNISDKDEEF